MARTQARDSCDHMKILIVNPNTTSAMTDKIRAAACLVAAAGTQIIAVNPADGPVAL